MSTAHSREAGGTGVAPPLGTGDGAANGATPVRSGGPARERRALLGDVRTRVLVSFLILLIASTAASLLVLQEVLFSRIGDDVQERLTRQVDSLRLLTSQKDPRTGEAFDGDLSRVFDVYLAQQRPLDEGALATFIDGSPYRSDPGGLFASAFSSLATIDEPTTGELSDPAGDLSFVAVPVEGRGESGVLVAGKLLRDERDRVESAVRIAAGVSIVITLLASLFIWLAAGRAVQPLRALARATRTITETDITERVPVRGDSEIAELGRTFNDMLDRLQSALANQKEFLVDVGHELRTPITVIRGNLETLSEDPAERREAVHVINDELERMSRLVGDLLLLARSDRPDFLRTEPLDLDVLTNELFAKARALGVRRWLIDGVGVGLLQADPYRLTSAVMNLAENAVRHTRGDQAIALGSAMEGDVARIWVRDEGEGIPPAEQQRIFERFASGAESKAGHGAGLGLAIVTAIADAHGGHVELESVLGAGSKFTIVLPVHEEPPDDEVTAWPES